MQITFDNYKEYLEERALNVEFGEITYYATNYRLMHTAILFVHGSGGDRNWFVHHLIKYDILHDYNWLVPTLFGYDRKEKPHKLNAFSMEQFAQDMVDLLEHENVDQLVILGHSMGGKVGALLVDYLMQDQETQKIKLLGFYNAEGPYLIEEFSEDDLSIARRTPEEYEERFNTWQQTFLDKDDKMSQIMWKHNETLGSYLIWAVYHNFTTLVEEKDLFESLLKYTDRTKLAYDYDEKSGELPTMKLYKDQGLEVLKVPDAGHIMMGENPVYFWRLILGSVQNLI